MKIRDMQSFFDDSTSGKKIADDIIIDVLKKKTLNSAPGIDDVTSRTVLK